MTPAAIIEQAAADGVTLVLTPSGTIRAAGNSESIEWWRAILAEHKSSIVTALREAANDAAAYYRWSITHRNLPAMEVAITPAVTAAEVLALYPGAGVSPLPEPPRRMATPAERAELRVLIERVLANEPDEWDEVHRIACAEPDAAILCWRTLAAAMTTALPSPWYELPTCRQCRNLASNGRCLAAARGALPCVASKRYEPGQDIGRRCEGYAPGAADPDQRSGSERWPELTPKGPTHG